MTQTLVQLASRKYPVPDLAAGTTVAGRYTVGERLGEGLLGPVFAVTDTDGSLGALKLLRPGVIDERLDLARLQAWVGRVSKQNPSGLVLPRACGEHDGHLFLEMERVPGRSLRRAIDEFKGGAPIEWVEEVFYALLEVLESRHPGTHGHFGAEHVLIPSEPGDGVCVVRLSSWGRNRLLRPGLLDDAELGREGAWTIAPERTDLNGQSAPEAQTYAVTAMLYEALTGRTPDGQYQLPSYVRQGVPQGFDDLVEVGLAYSNTDRFHKAVDLRIALEDAAGSVAVDRAGIKRLAGGLAGLAVIVVLAVVTVVLLKPSQDDLRAREGERRDELRASINPGRQAPPGPPPAPGMVWVGEGEYLAGRFAHFDEQAGAAEREEQIRKLDGFWIDELPFVNPRLDDPGAPPLTGMTWTQARDLCGKFNKRLCSEDEWEKACKGPKNTIFSYGDAYDADTCPPPGFLEGGYRLGDFPACVSGYGVAGLSGGVGEWTSTAHGSGHLVKPAEVGGSPKDSRCAGRADRHDEFKSSHLGMRCCHD